MSNEFGRDTVVFTTLRRPKFVAGVRVRAWHAIQLILGQAESDARAADSVDYTGGIAWRGSQGRLQGARPALEGQK